MKMNQRQWWWWWWPRWCWFDGWLSWFLSILEDFYYNQCAVLNVCPANFNKANGLGRSAHKIQCLWIYNSFTLHQMRILHWHRRNPLTKYVDCRWADGWMPWQNGNSAEWIKATLLFVHENLIPMHRPFQVKYRFSVLFNLETFYQI